MLLVPATKVHRYLHAHDFFRYCRRHDHNPTWYSQFKRTKRNDAYASRAIEIIHVRTRRDECETLKQKPNAANPVLGAPKNLVHHAVNPEA